MKIFLILTFALSALFPLSARPLIGLSVEADAGLAPLLFINQDALALHLLLPLSGEWALESETLAGFTVMVYPQYSTPRYPPNPTISSMNWFFLGEELGLSLPFRIGGNDSSDFSLRLRPISLSAVWAPLYYALFGAGTAIELEFLDRNTGSIIRPFGLYAKVNYRPSDLSFKAFFQIGGRFTILW